MLKNKYLIWQNCLFGVLQCDKARQFVKLRFESAQAKYGPLPAISAGHHIHHIYNLTQRWQYSVKVQRQPRNACNAKYTLYTGALFVITVNFLESV